MLSSDERKRLIDRNSKNMDSQTRASNDYRARTKLKNWFKTDLLDAALILFRLQGKKLNTELKKVLHDEDVYALLLIAEQITSVLGFYPLEGDLENPDAWKIPRFVSVLSAMGIMPAPNENRTVSDKDIERAAVLDYLITKITNRHLGLDNPVCKARYYDFMLTLPPKYEARVNVTEKEKMAIDKISGTSKKVRNLWAMASGGDDYHLSTMYPFLIDLNSKEGSNPGDKSG